MGNKCCKKKKKDEDAEEEGEGEEVEEDDGGREKEEEPKQEMKASAGGGGMKKKNIKSRPEWDSSPGPTSTSPGQSRIQAIGHGNWDELGCIDEKYGSSIGGGGFSDYCGYGGGKYDSYDSDEVDNGHGSGHRHRIPC